MEICTLSPCKPPSLSSFRGSTAETRSRSMSLAVRGIDRLVELFFFFFFLSQSQTTRLVISWRFSRARRVAADTSFRSIESCSGESAIYLARIIT